MPFWIDENIAIEGIESYGNVGYFDGKGFNGVSTKMVEWDKEEQRYKLIDKNFDVVQVSGGVSFYILQELSLTAGQSYRVQVSCNDLPFFNERKICVVWKEEEKSLKEMTLLTSFQIPEGENSFQGESQPFTTQLDGSIIIWAEVWLQYPITYSYNFGLVNTNASMLRYGAAKQVDSGASDNQFTQPSVPDEDDTSKCCDFNFNLICPVIYSDSITLNFLDVVYNPTGFNEQTIFKEGDYQFNLQLGIWKLIDKGITWSNFTNEERSFFKAALDNFNGFNADFARYHSITIEPGTSQKYLEGYAWRGSVTTNPPYNMIFIWNFDQIPSNDKYTLKNFEHHFWECCLSKNTLITLSDYSTKRLDELKSSDILLDRNFKETKILRLERPETFPNYTKHFFENDIIIEEITEHRFYNKTQGCWQRLKKWHPGDIAIDINGNEIKYLGKQFIFSPLERCVLITESGSYFANGLLSGEARLNRDLLADASLEQALDMMESLEEKQLYKLLNLEEELL